MVPLRFFKQIVLAALWAILVGVGGCGSDSDKVVVDFTKTVPVARPGERASPTPPLRVAVAAMISPKETFDLYRQLLAYLGRGLNKDLEFVQRKTYAENRLRLTAAGQLRPCLLRTMEMDLKASLRQGISDRSMARLFLEAIQLKGGATGFPLISDRFPTMASIGG